MPHTPSYSPKRGRNPSPIPFQCAEDESLLDAAEEAGFEWPNAARSGTDSTSTARLVKGSVDQHDQAFLSEEQVEAGYVLTEVAYPRSDCVLVVGVEGELHEDR